MTGSVTIVSYNILAAAYARPERYPRTDPDDLEWNTRKTRLLGWFRATSADVVCLQEVEPEAYQFLTANLEGFSGVYAQKAEGRPDGCATVWRNDRVRFVQSLEIYFHDGLGEEDSGHLALVVDCGCGLGRLRIVNTHLRWAPFERKLTEHIGYRQARELLKCYFEDSGPLSGVICGDFNAESTHPLLQQFIESGFNDAFANNPQPTCNPHSKAKRIDYLLHTSDLRSEPQRLRNIGDQTPLPSREEPSDHLAVVAAFTRREVHPMPLRPQN